MGLASDAIFYHHRDTDIQTEVTLQPDYMCCLRMMGKQSPIAEIVILSPSVPDSHSLRTYPKVSCVNFLFARLRH